VQHHDVIIIGAGAAGLMCAGIAGQRGKRVLLLDHNDRPGAKILISGGGRCNFTNIHTAPDRFLSANPHFCKSALGRYTAQDFIDLVERHGIRYHEKTLGQLFCDNSAKDIVAALTDECEKGHVDMRLSQAVTGIDHADDLFHVTTNRDAFTARSLVIATGGPAIPKMGATGLAYDIARRFGLKVVEPRPALVPLTFGADMAPFGALAGVSAEIIARCGKAAFREAALFTHRGLSGPAILQISSYWRHGEAVRIDFAPGEDMAAMLREARSARPRAEPRTVLSAMLPARLAALLAEQTGIGSGQMANVSDKAIDRAAAQIHAWPFIPTGTEGFAKAEVTAGGVSTDGLSSRTMAARKLPGLYFIGEAVDVTGWLGGYNFQWAWSSGWCAGQAIE